MASTKTPTGLKSVARSLRKRLDNRDVACGNASDCLVYVGEKSKPSRFDNGSPYQARSESLNIVKGTRRYQLRMLTVGKKQAKLMSASRQWTSGYETHVAGNSRVRCTSCSSCLETLVSMTLGNIAEREMGLPMLG